MARVIRYNRSPETKAQQRLGQLTKRPLAIRRVCATLDCTTVFVPKVGNQKRCPECCARDPWNDKGRTA